MRSFIFFMLFCVLAALSSFGQRSDGLVVDCEENRQWLLKLEKMSLSEQLSMVRQRVLSDTAIYVRKYASDRITSMDWPRPDASVEGCCKPFFTLGRNMVDIRNGTSTRFIKTFARLLSEDNISYLDILNAEESLAIYGSRGACGVIIMMMPTRRAERRAHRLLMRSSKE